MKNILPTPLESTLNLDHFCIFRIIRRLFDNKLIAAEFVKLIFNKINRKCASKVCKRAAREGIQAKLTHTIRLIRAKSED